MNPAVNTKQAVIWGTGNNGKTAYEILTKNGIEVNGFIDAKFSGSGKQELNGIPIWGLNRLEDLDNNIMLVEAYEKYYEMDEVIRANYPNITKRFYCDVHSLQIFYTAPGEEKVLFHLVHDRLEFSKLCGKSVKLYGMGRDAVELSHYLRLMDFNVSAYLDDDENGKCENMEQYPVIPVEEILYEDNYAIWILDNEAERAKKYLKDLGVCFDLDVVMSRQLCTILDVNLGYTYDFEGYHAGMVIYGQERRKNYRIVTLGGSTTDGTWKNIKSWPLFLYEQCNRKDITVYNAGVTGYVSGQECIRLIRDILPLKPDMVIVYNGANDSGGNVVIPEEPYAFDYARTVYEFGQNIWKISTWGKRKNDF